MPFSRMTPICRLRRRVRRLPADEVMSPTRVASRRLSGFVTVAAAMLIVALSMATGAGAQAPGAPTISSATAGDGSLTVTWTAPGDTGGSPVTSYDLRHIESSATDKSDANWIVVDSVWSYGALTYTVTGLLGDTAYDTQIRAGNTSGKGAWSAPVAGTPTVGAAVIASVTAGDRALTVVWSAPAGVAVSSITAYDLRHIASSAQDTSDDEWTVTESVWTSGADGKLQHILTGPSDARLANNTGYNVQVRAVTASKGAWSATSTGTPAEHGDTAAAATAVTSGVPLGGVIQSASDADYFKVTLSEASGLLVYTTGSTDTSGELFDSSKNAIIPDPDPESDSVTVVEPDSGFIEKGENFFISTTQAAGAYYVKVTGGSGATGSYALHAEAISDTTGTADAQPVELGGSAFGIVHGQRDLDYFKLVLPVAADVIVRASGAVSDLVGEVIRPDETVAVGNGNGFMLPNERDFLIRGHLAVGTYYVKVAERHNESGYRIKKSNRYKDKGAYVLSVQSATEPGDTPATAAPLALGGIAGGNIASATDVDYFRIEVAASAKAVIRAVAQTVEVDGALLDSASNPVQADVHEETFSRSDGLRGFTIRYTLAAGTHYVKISRSSDNPDAAERGSYTVQALLAADAPERSYPGISEHCRYSGTAVDDPLYGCQWHLKNIGLYGGTASEDINVESVWAAGNLGQGVNVAVVDDGVDVAHEDLRENADASLSHGYRNSYLTHPNYDHGTHVAGIIAGRDNALGIRGVAPRATVYGYRLMHLSFGGRDGITDAELADAMIRNLAETAISNNSWGSGHRDDFQPVSQSWVRAVTRGVNEGFGGKGIFYSWAAGNSHSHGANANYDEYANHYAVAPICAVNKQGKRSSYSETGAVLWVCAPSADGNEQDVQIVSTDVYDGYSEDFGGTSAAAPVVSGVAALVRSAHPNLTWRDVKLILAGSARKNDPGTSDNPTGWESGALEYGSTTDTYDFNHQYGFGVVDAAASVKLANTWTPLPRFVSEHRVSTDTDIAVPDTPPATTAESTVTVGSKVQFTEFVELNIEFGPREGRPKVRHLDIELVSPSGKTSKIAEYCDRGVDGRGNDLCTFTFDGGFRFGSARHLGEDPAGTWTLKATDRVPGGTATVLTSWDIRVYGHRSTPGAPVADSTTAVDEGKVTVFWSAPDNPGASAVTAYDVRHIANDASDKSDSKWTITRSAGANGRIRGYTIPGLVNGTAYEVQVRAVNAEGDGVWSGTVTGTPAAAVSAPPYFTEGSTTVRSVPENTPVGVSVGAAVTAVDTDGDALTYTLGGTDAAHFTIAASTGQLRTKSTLNYENKSSYTVTVSVSDHKDSNGQPDTAADDTITVEIDRAGAVTLSTNSPRIGTAVTAALTDPDGGITGTSWGWKRSADKTTWTVITGAGSSTHKPTSADAGSYLQASAGYTDARGSGKTASAVTHNRVPSPSQPVVPPTTSLPPAQPPPTTSLPPAQPPPTTSLPPAQPPQPFSDLQEAGVHETAVRALADEGVLTGTGCAAERLCPGGALRRWEAAVWLVRVLDGKEPTGTVSGRFTDVDDEEWWAAHVERLAELKITLGCSLSPARFCPDKRVTRAQMASFLKRAFELPAAQQPAGFQDTTGNTHETAINALHQAGVTNGCRINPLLYCPRRHTTRAQMASFLHRARTH